MARDACVPTLVVSYEELVERSSVISSYGKTQVEECEDEEELERRVTATNDLHHDDSVLDGASGDCANDQSRHGLFQLKPTQLQAIDRGRVGRKGARDRVGGGRGQTHHRKHSSDYGSKARGSQPVVGWKGKREGFSVRGVGNTCVEWSSKESALENLLSRWGGSPMKLDRIFSTWYVMQE